MRILISQSKVKEKAHALSGTQAEGVRENFES
jgi:hypothetical protein